MRELGAQLLNNVISVLVKNATGVGLSQKSSGISKPRVAHKMSPDRAVAAKYIVIVRPPIY